MRSRDVIPAESGTCGPARPAAWLFHDRAQLQDPERGSGILRGNLNRLVHVAAFENVEAGDMQRLLVRLASVNAQLTLSYANRPRVGYRAEHVACHAHAAGVHLVAPRGHCGGDRRSLLGVELDIGVAVGEEDESDGCLLGLGGLHSVRLYVPWLPAAGLLFGRA